MILLKVRSVQPVGNRAQLTDQVFTLHVTDETVGVRKAQMKSVAKFRQQTIVVEFIHHEFRNLQNRTSDGDRLRQSDFRALILDERQVCVYDLPSLVARLSDRADELIGSLNRRTLTLLRTLSTVLP